MASTVLERIRAATADERGQIGRDIYTYLHLPSIAGIVLVAVGDDLVIAHPTDDLNDAGTLVALGGPALFLGGLIACAARLGQTQSLPRAVAVVALLAAVPLAGGADGLVVSALLTALLAVLVIAEQLRRAHEIRGRARAAPRLVIPGASDLAAHRLPQSHRRRRLTSRAAHARSGRAPSTPPDDLFTLASDSNCDNADVLVRRDR